MKCTRRLASITPLLIGLAACGGDGPTNPTGITGVRVEAPGTQVPLGASLQLAAFVDPSSEPQGVSWSTSDAAIAAVDGTGLVTGVSAGSAQITATSTADPARSASLTLTVSPCPLPREVSGGPMSTDATWENWIELPECVDYLVKGGITNSGGLLTIEPGVRAAWEEGTLVIRGSGGLLAVGTDTDPIVLTGTDSVRGHWGGVWLDGTAHAENRLEYITIEYTGGGNLSGSIRRGSLIMTGSETSLLHTTLRQSSAHGLTMNSGAVLRTHGQNNLTENALGPAFVNTSQAHFLDPFSSGFGNDVDHVLLHGNTIDEIVTWVPFGDAYVVRKQSAEHAFDVEGGTLRLDPGVRILFEENMGMTVSPSGAIEAEGTVDAPVVFSGLERTPGFWWGVRIFSADSINRFDHVLIEYAGSNSHSGSIQRANLFLDEDASIEITNSFILDGSGYGIHARHNAKLPGFANNEIFGHALGPAHVRATVAADLDPTSTYIGNARDVIDVYAYTSRITEPTVWEDIGVPYVIVDTPNGLYVDLVDFTVDEGTEILFAGDVGLLVEGGSLTFDGTETNPIRLAGVNNAWKGVQVFRSSATFTYTTIESAGSSSWGAVQPSGAVTINTASDQGSFAFFGEGTGHTDTAGGLGIVFGAGQTTANCAPMTPVHVPAGDLPTDHCN